MKDLQGRSITYLRISVTDRCNFRCVYCMPDEGVVLQKHDEIMRYEEIVQVVKSAVRFGIRKIRITGGEPLVRPGLVDLVQMIHEVDGIKDISLTTNGYLLGKYASELKNAGLNRVNISLDTLKADLFSKITRYGQLQKVLDGIYEAERVGLTPIKLNIVAMRGVNDEEFADFVRLTYENDWHIRFIELMPVKNQTTWGNDFPDYEFAYISTEEMLAQLKEFELLPFVTENHLGPAKLYRAKGAKGKVGFISPIDDEHFCERCNRIRLTADGSLRSCLMSEQEFPLLETLRKGGNMDEILEKAILFKPIHHHLKTNQPPKDRSMMQIGG